LEKLKKHIEALIYASETGISIGEIEEVLSAGNWEDIPPIQQLIDEIAEAYQSPDSILELKRINNSYQFLTKTEYHETINQLQSHRSRKKLSQAALETLAIIAYRQPITKLEVEHIRGVNCDYTIQRLLERGMIAIIGKADSPGKPLIYGTSDLLMDYFGLNDVSELPKLKEIVGDDQAIGVSRE